MEDNNSNQNFNNAKNINLLNSKNNQISDNMQSVDYRNNNQMPNNMQNIDYRNNNQMPNNMQNIDYRNNNQMPNNMQTKNGMLNQIKALNFSIIEISLYLNTHPNDIRALNIHKRYCNELHNLKDKYQKMFGPLSIYCPCNRWRWLEEPWPWEGGMN